MKPNDAPRVNGDAVRADLARAEALLREGDYTCVLCREETAYTATRRGVAPLLEFLDEYTPLHGFSAADRVVGKAAAYLYLLLRVTAVYTPVISTPARELLTSHGVAVRYDREVPAIRNRTDTGFCPMETAVWDIDEPQAALATIRRTLTALQQKG